MSERKPHFPDEKGGKGVADEIRYVPADEDSQPAIGEGIKTEKKVDNTEEIALYALHVDDDPYLNILGLVNGKR